ncbi:MAG: hypothetical protein JW963_25700 [Anaerolineales bacterium]|nr:hypothetical protein [Anaerolineales bacterium]
MTKDPLMGNLLSSQKRPIITATIVSTAMIAIYVWVYSAAPFSESINFFILNGFTSLAALLCAIILTLTSRYFLPGEAPRTIWLFFAICLWFWTVAEAYWGYLYTTVGEVPAFSLADVLWFAGYLAFTISIVRQYRLVFFERRKNLGLIASGVWAIVLAVTAILVLTTESLTNNVENYVVYFYPVADTTIGLAALYIVYTFRGRTLAGPWLTMFAFVVSDILYIGLTASGVYDWEMQGISLSLFADTIYLVAYILVGWGALQQYLLLRSGSNDLPASG